MLAIVLLVVVSSLEGKTINGRRRNSTATARKPVIVKICGVALVRMLDLVCTRARQLVLSNQTPSPSPGKRQLRVDDDPFSQTLSITDYARKRQTLASLIE